jgi:HNH endonuclease
MDTARMLTTQLANLLRREHVALTEFLLALADFDRRRLWLDLGHPSLFHFLHRELGLSKGAAHYRKTAAELVQKFPEIIEPLRDGRLCITSIVHLAKVLTAENRVETLPRFFHRSRREAMEVAAAINPAEAAPRRDVVTTVRAPSAGRTATGLASGAVDLFPGSASVASASAGVAPAPVAPLDSGVQPAERRAPAPASPVQPAERRTAPPGALAQPSEMRIAPPVPPGDPVQPGELHPESSDEPRVGGPPAPAGLPKRDSADPITAELSRLHVTVSRRFLEKLEAARAALSHSLPGATAGEILEAGLDLVLAGHAKRKGLVQKPRKEPRPRSKSDGVPAHVRRVVWTRDGGRCQWPLESGGICGSTRRVEFDHVIPRARGGPSTVENTRLLCRIHNDLAARHAFGDDWMDRFTRTRSSG